MEMYQKGVVEKIETRVLWPKTFFRKSCRLCDNVKNMVQPDRPHMTMQWCIDEMGITCWITQAKIQTHL